MSTYGSYGTHRIAYMCVAASAPICQDPAVLERLQSLSKDQTFQARVQQMASNPAFMDAAGQYAEEMKDEIVAEAKAAGDSLEDRSASELDDEDNEDGEDDLEDDEGA